MSYTEFIESNLTAVSEVSLRGFGNIQSVLKKDDANQVVTETDIEIGKQLISSIRSTYPKHNIIDEEAGCIDQGSIYTWVIDPIDGTSNYALGIPTFGVLLGLLENDVPIAGGIALPFFHEIYLAERGAGATRNGQRVHVTEEPLLENALVSYGIDSQRENPSKTQSELLVVGKIINGIRNLRTSNSVFDIAQVVDGRYGVSLNRQSKIWDNVAQQIVIEEAGGVYTDFFGQPMDYRGALQRAEDNFTWCAGAPALHRQVQRIINSD